MRARKFASALFTSKSVVSYDLTRLIVGSQGMLNPDKMLPLV